MKTNMRILLLMFCLMLISILMSTEVTFDHVSVLTLISVHTHTGRSEVCFSIIQCVHVLEVPVTCASPHVQYLRVAPATVLNLGFVVLHV